MTGHWAPRGDVVDAVDAALDAAARANGILPKESLVVTRPNTHTDDPAERCTAIEISQTRHPDHAFLRLRRVITVGNGDGWRHEMTREIDDAVADVAPSVRRRRAFDPDASGADAPRWTWSLHPVTASLMAHHGAVQNPCTLRHSRNRGEIGYSLESEPRNGLRLEIECNEGLIRLIQAEIVDAAGDVVLTIREEAERMIVRLPYEMPTTLALGVARSGLSAISPILTKDPRAARCRITKTWNDGDTWPMRTAFMLRDVLVPWDRRRGGGEDWRPTCLSRPKRKSPD